MKRVLLWVAAVVWTLAGGLWVLLTLANWLQNPPTDVDRAPAFRLFIVSLTTWLSVEAVLIAVIRRQYATGPANNPSTARRR